MPTYSPLTTCYPVHPEVVLAFSIEDMPFRGDSVTLHSALVPRFHKRLLRMRGCASLAPQNQAPIRRPQAT